MLLMKDKTDRFRGKGKRNHLFIALGIMAAGFTLAAGASLRPADLGDAPPEFKISQWLSTKAVQLSDLKGKSVCVVDFFRTWYPPCRFHLLEEFAAQKELGKQAVTFIGLTDEPAWQVEELRKELPREFAWNVALDPGDSALKSLLGLGQGQEIPNPGPLPFTMILDKSGRIVFLGSAPDDIRAIVRQVASGTWDVERVRKQRQDLKLLPELLDELKPSMPAGQCGRIVALAERLSGLDLPESKATLRMSGWHNAALKLLEDPACGPEYTEKALKLARMALGLGYYKPYETLAEALFRTGSLKEAVLAQKKAVSVVGDEGIKARLQKQLAEYAAVLAQKTGESIDLNVAPKAAPAKSGSPETYTPPAGLTSAQAIEDLESLHGILLKGYAGYDDFEWKLRLAGSSWGERLASFKEKAAARAAWTAEDFFALAAEFLRPVVDEHFYIELPAAEGKGPVRRERFTVRHNAYFSGLRIADAGGRMVVRSTDPAHKELTGWEVRDVAVAAAENAVPDTPYLFPTVPESGKAKEYLLGVFLSQAPEKPRPFHFHSGEGKRIEVDLELHRCRVKDPNPGKGDAWSLSDSGASALPALRVRTAVEDKITGDFLKSAETLRQAGAAILDLRANGGGSDSVAMDWCGLISPQDYMLGAGNAIIAGGPGSPSRRWNPLTLGPPFRMEGPAGRNPGKARFHGRLFVIMDINTASSGETFAGLAKQIPGTVLVGENSRGCTRYGNADIIKRLPASRIAVRFGWVRFNWAGVHPIREGVGFFPDYWIDEADPNPAIARLASIMQ